MSARKYSAEDIALIEELASAKARVNFYAFRRLMGGTKFVTNWWVKETARHLQAFYERFIAGERPKMLLLAPPQHGKSRMVTDFDAWISGRNPNTKSIFASYSDDLGTRTNSALQRMFDDIKFQKTFPDFRLARAKDAGLRRTSTMLDFVGYDGSFRNTTVLGQVTGQSLDFGLIDDPIKGRKEASSETIRNSTWDWLADDFFTRFSDHAALLMIMTRWHVDDPAGRFLQKFPKTVVLDYPAIATHDELHRKMGEPLFPEFKSKAFIDERRAIMTKASFESLYQQSPIIAGGGMFPIAKFGILTAKPAKAQIKVQCRYWDKAGTHGDGAYTAGVLIAALYDGTYAVLDVRRGQWSAFERETIIHQTAVMDGVQVPVVVEQEPGSGGKESAENTIKMLAGFNVSADKVTGNKEFRAEPYAAQVQAGNFLVMNDTWTRAFLDEHEEFPNGPFKDQVDAATGAFTKVTLGTTYDQSMRWVTGV